MANYISNQIIIDGSKERIKLCIANIMSDPKPLKYTTIDFNKIIPLKDINDCVECWGTKGCFYPLIIENGIKSTYNSFGFYTLWAHPNKIMLELSRQYPDLTFTLKYCDENGANNEFGIKTYKNGTIIKKEVPIPKTKEFEELFRSLFPLLVDESTFFPDCKNPMDINEK